MGVNGENMLPDGWEVIRIDQFCSLGSGATPPRKHAKKYFSGGTTPWVKTGDLTNGLIDTTDEKITQAAIQETSCRVYPANTLLLAMYGGFRQIGRTGLLRNEAAINQALTAINPDSKKALSSYLQLWLNFKVDCWRQFAGSSRKDPNITKSDIAAFPVLLPPLPVQHRIADILLAWVKAEDHCTALIDAKCRLRAALHHQMLTRSRGVTDSHPSPWPRRLMGDIVERVRRPVEVQPDTEYREIGIRSHGKGVFHKETVLGEELGDKAVFWVQPDCLTFNVVFAWEQAVAVTSSAEAGMIASHRFPMYKPKPGLLSLRYALLYLLSKDGKVALELGSPGGAGRNRTLSQEAFNKIAIPLPPFEEQERIADVLSAMDREVALLRQYLDALKKQKKGLMQKLLTGQVRV